MVAAVSMYHGRQQESVHCPRWWYFCAWRRLPGSRYETVEEDAREEVTTSKHWERPYIVSSYGKRIASSFEVHRHRVCRLLLEVRHRVSRLPLLQVHERVSKLLLQVRHSVRPLLLFQVRHHVRPHLLLQVRHSVRPLLLLQLSHVSRLRRLSNRRRDTPQLWCVAVRVEVVQKVQAETSDINMVQAASLLFLRGLTT